MQRLAWEISWESAEHLQRRSLRLGPCENSDSGRSSRSWSDFRKTDLDLKKENKNENKRKGISASLERSRLAPARWQGLFWRWLLPQRADGSGSGPDEEWLRNHFRQPERQHAATGCQFSYGHVLRWGRGQA